jgi:hypothetical protein
MEGEAPGEEGARAAGKGGEGAGGVHVASLAKAEKDTAEVVDSRSAVLSITSRTEGMVRGGISELGMGRSFSSYTLCSFS